MPESQTDFSRRAFDLDPSQAAARKDRRRRKLNTVEIPRLRAFGSVLLAVGALVHERWLRGQFSWDTWFTIVAVLGAYGIVSWLVLSRLYTRVRAFDLSVLFLGLDLLVWASVIYLTGATQSWLFFILLARVADQIPISFRRALVFALLAPLAYVLVVLAAELRGLPFAWPAEIAKIAFLYTASLYMASVARIVERHHTQRVGALRLARELIQRHEVQQAELSAARLRAEAALDQQAGLAAERARLYERAERQQVLLQRIFDSTSDGLVLVGVNGRVESANARAAALVGFDLQAATGSNVVDLLGYGLREIGTGERWRPALLEILNEPSRPAQGDVAVGTGDRILQWTAAPAHDSLGLVRGLTLTFQDVTRNRDLIRQIGSTTAELAVTNRRIEDAHRLKEEFLANVSHELRTPLSAIVGMSQLAVDAATEPERRRYLDMLRVASDGLATIINDILDFSRIEAGRFLLAPAPFLLHDVLNAVVDTVRLPADAKQLDLRWSVDPEVPDHLVGDAARLRQILLNLASNAVKFTERGAVGLEVVLVERTADAATIEVAVKDTGIGIPPDKQQAIFEAFVQADGSTTRRYGGAGLGLSISSRLAELMGGEIGVESEEGAGSTFRFKVSFGLAPAGGSTQPAPPDAVPARRDAALAGRILVADDNAIQREMVLHLLGRCGYDVTAVESGAGALAALDHGEFDLILVDLQMPEMDGFQTAAAIRRREASGGRRVPIVAVTASALKSDRDRCLEVGIDDYVSKPMSKDQLVTMVAAHMTNAPAPAQTPWQPTDRAAYLRALGDDHDLARRLVAIFVEQAPSLLEAIRAAAAAGDAHALSQASHRLKGAMGNFPAIAAQDLATRLENAALAGHVQTARVILPSLEREMARMLRALPDLP